VRRVSAVVNAAVTAAWAEGNEGDVGLCGNASYAARPEAAGRRRCQYPADKVRECAGHNHGHGGVAGTGSAPSGSEGQTRGDDEPQHPATGHLGEHRQPARRSVSRQPLFDQAPLAPVQPLEHAVLTWSTSALSLLCHCFVVVEIVVA
jgi:hypothetical protein